MSKKADGHNDATRSPHQCKELDLTIAERKYWFDSMHVSTRCLTLAALVATIALAGCKTTGTGSIAPTPAVASAPGSTAFITALQGGIVGGRSRPHTGRWKPPPAASRSPGAAAASAARWLRPRPIRSGHRIAGNILIR